MAEFENVPLSGGSLIDEEPGEIFEPDEVVEDDDKDLDL